MICICLGFGLPSTQPLDMGNERLRGQLNQAKGNRAHTRRKAQGADLAFVSYKKEGSLYSARACCFYLMSAASTLYVLLGAPSLILIVLSYLYLSCCFMVLCDFRIIYLSCCLKVLLN
jgi:hypothetical protein